MKRKNDAGGKCNISHAERIKVVNYGGERTYYRDT